MSSTISVDFKRVSNIFKAFHPAPILRIFEVCNSLPFGMLRGNMDWGHDYRGLAIPMDSTQFFPWEQRLADRVFPDGWFKTPFSADPLTVSEVVEILREEPTCTPPPSKEPFPTVSAVVLGGNDPFISLPTELCSAIAAYLETRDVLNARCAQQFWAPRFRGNSDRSWLFEFRNHKDAIKDWRWLYRRTVDGRIRQAPRNRKQIWNLIQDLADVLELSWTELPSELPPLWRSLPLPRNYITGIFLTTSTGETVRLGYRNSSERSVQLSGELAGFNVAVGLGGIHALQCINRETRESIPWLGCPDDVPRTERLSLGTRIIALEAGFDGFRMVRIAVAPQQSDIPRAPWNDHNRLRHSAIWYPDVPPLSLDLNEDFFLPLQNYTWGFRPLFWSCFRGPGGIYLPCLTRIRAGLWAGLRRLDFFFNKAVPAECQSFGRHEDSEYGQVVEFSIDGPGGEIIEAIEIWQRYPLKMMALLSGLTKKDVWPG
ncbi:hypothetical protein P885DRAFT_71777 [Corynascus similis CBS 632.67]